MHKKRGKKKGVKKFIKGNESRQKTPYSLAIISIMPATAAAVAPSPAWANPNGRPSQPTVEISDDQAMNELLEPFSTLDEPVLETIMRDVRAVGSKLRIVMLPLDRNMHFGYSMVDTSEGNSTEELGENQKKVIEILKDWDLW